MSETDMLTSSGNHVDELRPIASTAYPNSGVTYRLDESQSAPSRSSGGIFRRLGALGVAAAFLLGKFKYLLMVLKFAKFHTIITMMVAVWAYAQIWGAPFAVGFVSLIFIHECGHALVMRHQNVPAGAPVFIPFVGAVIAMRGRPRNAYVEALIGLGGPFLGTAGAVVCFAIGWLTQQGIWYALAYTGFMLNLFNMIPLSPLDGGRIVGVLSPWLWIAGFGVGSFVFFQTRSPILLLILILGVFSFIKSLKKENAAYYHIHYQHRMAIGAAYFALLLIMAIGMWGAQGALGNLS